MNENKMIRKDDGKCANIEGECEYLWEGKYCQLFRVQLGFQHRPLRMCDLTFAVVYRGKP